MQEDPRLFIYERLHARYAERSRSLSGKSKSLPGERDGPGVEKAGHAELFQAAESALQCKSTEELWKAEAKRREAFSQTSNQAIDMLLNSWSALNLNGRSLQEIIRQSDVNQDGMLDKAELLAIMKANNLSVKEPDVDKVWRFVASSTSEANAKVGVEELQRAINLAVDRKYLADWIGEMKIHELISSHLLSDCRQPGMGRANPVKYLVDRAPNEVLRQIQAAVPDIQRAVCKAVADFLESTQGSKRSTSQVWWGDDMLHDVGACSSARTSPVASEPRTQTFEGHARVSVGTAATRLQQSCNRAAACRTSLPAQREEAMPLHRAPRTSRRGLLHYVQSSLTIGCVLAAGSGRRLQIFLERIGWEENARCALRRHRLLPQRAERSNRAPRCADRRGDEGGAPL